MTISFVRLAAAISEAPKPVRVFFRDDDAGWANGALSALCDLFANRAPLDLAVIPTEIDVGTAAELLSRPTPIGFHQHGFAHRNHQRHGKKCEFSDERSESAIEHDLRAGQQRMLELFGDRVDPIFTPPWNRCGQRTANALLDLGLTTLSRDAGAAPFAIPGLSEVPVSVDWTRVRDDVDSAMAAAVEHEGPIGVMLHHQILEPSDLDVISNLIEFLTDREGIEISSMMTATPRPGSQP